MTNPTPAPVQIQPAPTSPAVIATVRTLTPLVLGAIVYALSKANIHIDNATLDTIVNVVLSTVVAAAYKLVVTWLEDVKSSKWGKLFLIAKAPVYPATPLADKQAA